MIEEKSLVVVRPSARLPGRTCVLGRGAQATININGGACYVT